ncbi:hypothetical protein V8C37DRAFT_401536 [Trichoderma ceciliae]
MVSILEALTMPNVAITNYSVKGQNTTPLVDVAVETWRPWVDFNYNTLVGIFKMELAREYVGASDQKPLEQDLWICNEATVDDLVRRFIIPAVNYALADQSGACHYGRGSRCRAAHDPDWSVISNSCINNGAYVNILPGDTKVDAKWWPSMIGEAKNLCEWQKVMSQILAYMIFEQNRYGFILTDANLVVLRITRRHIGGGLAASRPRRVATAGTLATVATITTTTTATTTADSAIVAFPAPVHTALTDPVAATRHQRHLSAASVVSGASSSTSTYEGGSSFNDGNPFDWDYYPPEYAVIPWEAHGPGTLIVKLSLWCLAMMAANGDRDIGYSYPDLNTWRQQERKGYIHDTAGTTLTRLPPPHHLHAAAEDVPYYSQPGSAFGDDDAQEDEDDDDEERGNDDEPFESAE